MKWRRFSRGEPRGGTRTFQQSSAPPLWAVTRTRNSGRDARGRGAPFALKSDHNMARQLRPLVPWSVSARQQSMAPVVAIAKMVAVWSLKKEMPDPDGEIV